MQKSQRHRRNRLRRRLTCEPLEDRRLLAGDVLMCDSIEGMESVADAAAVAAARHNADCPVDVDANGAVTPRDVLMVIALLQNQRGELVARPEGESGDAYPDVNGDDQITPLDALMIVQYLLSAEPELPAPPPSPAPILPLPLMDPTELTADEVETLLARAAAASASNDAVIAIVDRGGTILGVRAEADVLATITDEPTLVFAIDGAVAKARTAAYFAHNQAPLTSRTIRNISQTTITQRQVESNPNVASLTERGPGTVAPIGLGGHFPPGIQHTPPVDLFDIEHTNRDTVQFPDPDGMPGTGDDPQRFNIPRSQLGGGVDKIPAPESYGFQSGRLPSAQSRGIATLPGGIPIYKHGKHVGGIGVFFPGPDGYATHEQGFVPLPEDAPYAAVAAAERARTNAERVLESEWIAYAALGGSSNSQAFRVGDLDGIAPVPGIDLPFGRLDLVGITLEVFGPNPTTQNPVRGIDTLKRVGDRVGRGPASSGMDQKVLPGGEKYLHGEMPPEGWLAKPVASGDLTVADIEGLVGRAIGAANEVRAGIRLPIGSRAKMVFAVSDLSGKIVGLYRMEDATWFSVGVAVAKARNMAYYADPTAIVDADRVDGVPKGAAFTNRTFRFLAEPRFPSGVDGTDPPPFSILNDGIDDARRINPATAENIGPPLPASAFTSVLGYNSFNPNTNLRDPDDPDNQSGVVFFPGAVPIYKDGKLVGGFGVSGDGVDQDDVVTMMAAEPLLPPDSIWADRFFVDGVRLPFLKFLRNPLA